ncbi:MAG: (2Fe-2S)-binding protein [Deltaproteobacteria bacterium RBG_16_49_23]|nr:MAG: (2Fe-2S)-binding protein [Deltaproteobacteria bacterium RBG_16_49_23]
MKVSKTYPLKLNVNGEWKKAEVTPRETLLHVMRERLSHTEVKEGCGKGDCGACAVLLDGKPVNACLTLALQADGQRVVTLKGIGTPDKPHPLQESFIKKGAIQCGFCSAGMIVTAKGLLDKNPKPSREEIGKAISGNLCRCTGYKKIIEAIEEAALKLRRTKNDRR